MIPGIKNREDNCRIFFRQTYKGHYNKHIPRYFFAYPQIDYLQRSARSGEVIGGETIWLPSNQLTPLFVPNQMIPLESCNTDSTALLLRPSFVVYTFTGSSWE